MWQIEVEESGSKKDLGRKEDKVFHGEGEWKLES